MSPAARAAITADRWQEDSASYRGQVLGISFEKKIHEEFRSGNRFRFGRNWQRFLSTVDERRIQQAKQRLEEILGVSSLNNKSFLDIGSGSGLHSLAARRLGAYVTSFDYDPESVQTTHQLRRMLGFDDRTWKIEVGSVLDSAYLSSLGQFDVVYSWGVLHHTGAMWQALENVQPLVKDGGKLYIAIYNDAGKSSRKWLKRKKTYCGLPSPLKPLYFLWIYTPVELRRMGVLKALGKGRLAQLPATFLAYLGEWKVYREQRGMSRFHDLVDWIGGYPYEFAKDRRGPKAARRRCRASRRRAG
jgi:2-polyprenyl-6-hydroxyphenyl methylase/3-demethylubiquinone-9 3-methyltransferase